MAEDTTTQTAKKEDEPEFHSDDLIARSGEFFGHEYTAADVAGGLHAGARKNFTVAQAKSQIDKWLKADAETTVTD